MIVLMSLLGLGTVAAVAYVVRELARSVNALHDEHPEENP